MVFEVSKFLFLPGISGGGGVSGRSLETDFDTGVAVTTGEERFGMSTSGKNLSLSFEEEAGEDGFLALPHETRSSFWAEGEVVLSGGVVFLGTVVDGRGGVCLVGFIF